MLENETPHNRLFLEYMDGTKRTLLVPLTMSPEEMVELVKNHGQDSGECACEYESKGDA